MLKNIRIHLEPDEQKQELLEVEFAQQCSTRLAKNRDAFLRNIPAVLPYISNFSNKSISVFCNKTGQANIVNLNNGRTVYGLDPEAEISRQVENFCAHSPYIDLIGASNKGKRQTDNYSDIIRQQEKLFNAPSELDCLVVFGIGLGLHLEELVRRFELKHLIIYEPDIQYFQCSTRTCNWNQIFKLAKQKNTSIYLQLEKDGRQVIQDIEELSQVASFNKVYLYHHYSHVVFNRAFNQLMQTSWEDLRKTGFSFDLTETLYDYCPVWTTPEKLGFWSDVEPGASRYQENMRAFKAFFPQIHTQMQDYRPQKWLPLQNAQGHINLVHRDTGKFWYGDDPIKESRQHFQSFSDRPNKDGLVLGYEGEKLAHYLHYKFVAKTEALLESTTDKVGALPDEVPSVILFGLAAGYQLEEFFFQKKIENLFICEPNLDFFHASLFAIDWKSIFKCVAEQELRIYINLGESSSVLIKDLMGQFYSIGPYLLNNTYFYQTYYNTALNNSVAQLREQLQIVIAMGEYFDHAYYGITHTRYSLTKDCRFLSNAPAQKLNFFEKEVPVFIIGNGPSLDDSITTIKEFQDRAIIISCGTALQSLYKNDIVPDFQAEIEQNRTTYDWASLIDADDYLKKISLITCNGIHPDTIALYKDVFITFKEGESSTVSVTKVFGEDNFEILKFAFPTVANFTTNLVTQMGFHNIYFMGVDLGFVDVKRHHSLHSAYYEEDGSPVYNYAEKNNTNLTVPGNFRARVNTKHEFYIAKQMLEQSIANKIKEVTFYNCSDGAAIAGAAPLRFEQILLTSEIAPKKEALNKIKNDLFQAHFDDTAPDKLDNQYSLSLLKEDFKRMQRAAEKPLTTFEQGEELTRQQRKILFDSYKKGRSLFFYYLYGTVNYANAVLAKLIYASADSEVLHRSLQEFKSCWLDYLSQIEALLITNQYVFDISKYRASARIMLKNKKAAKGLSLAVITDSAAFAKATQVTMDMFTKDCSWKLKGKIISPDEKLKNKHDLVIYFTNFQNDVRQLEMIDKGLHTGNKGTIFIVSSETAKAVIVGLKHRNPEINTQVIVAEEFEKLRPRWLSWHPYIIQRAIELGLQGYRGAILLPKYLLHHSGIHKDFRKRAKPTFTLSNCKVDYGDHIALFDSNKNYDPLLPNGNRGIEIQRPLQPSDLVLGYIDDKTLQKKVDFTFEKCPLIVKDKIFNNQVVHFGK